MWLLLRKKKKKKKKKIELAHWELNSRQLNFSFDGRKVNTYFYKPLSFMWLKNNLCKFFNPRLQFFGYLFLRFSETRRHYKEVLLHAVNEWNGKLVVNHTLLGDYNQPAKIVSQFNTPSN